MSLVTLFFESDTRQFAFGSKYTTGIPTGGCSIQIPSDSQDVNRAVAVGRDQVSAVRGKFQIRNASAGWADENGSRWRTGGSPEVQSSRVGSADKFAGWPAQSGGATRLSNVGAWPEFQGGKSRLEGISVFF
jgi:hypothetical protein